jgi:predicted sulfurtransferase
MGKRAFFGMVVLFLAAMFISGGISQAGDVKRMSKESLKNALSNPDVIVVDVRLPKDWDASELQIKGAVREDPSHVKDWMTKYPKDKTLVFYCA